jgi:hypothetical protein
MPLTINIYNKINKVLPGINLNPEKALKLKTNVNRNPVAKSTPRRKLLTFLVVNISLIDIY